MEGSFINNIFGRVKNKFSNNKNNYSHLDDYSFSGEELDDLTKQNMEEIDKLRSGYKNKDNNIDNNKDNTYVSVNDVKDIDEDIVSDNEDELYVYDNGNDTGYINLSSERRENIMKRWNSIDLVSLSKDIDRGKDILEHNYIITYPDMALSYIYAIRDEYDILIEYLIGFNNEKKGIMDKNIFSSKLDDEWRYLNSYIKILEKIKSAINR